MTRCAQDARLLFLLKRHEFVEHLRRGGMEGRKQALGAHPAGLPTPRCFGCWLYPDIAFTHVPKEALRPI